jgi:hypothetical protein
MKLTVKIFGLLFLLIIVGCSDRQSDSFDLATEQSFENISKQAQPENDSPQELNDERKLIKEGSVEFETDDIVSSRDLIFKSVKALKGYISSDQEYKSSGRVSNTIVIRVPALHFDQLLMDATKGISKFDNKSIEVKDVTEEFLDIEARLKTKKELENRYLEILKQANNVTEILKVEEQIGQLRSEIESIEGRLRYLKSKISLSTLTMTIYQTEPNSTNFGNKFADGFKNGWDNLVWFFVYLINIWPFILIAIIMIFGIKALKKRKVK